MPMDIARTLKQATQLHQAGRLREAEALYHQILAVQPGHADVLHYLGAMGVQLGKFDAAAGLLRRAVAGNPNFPEAWFQLGNALHGKGDVPGAIGAYQRAAAMRGSFVEAQAALAGAALQDRHYDVALKAAQKAVALAEKLPADADFFGGRGAREEPRRQRLAGMYAGLGAIHLALGRIDETLAAARRAVEIHPGAVAAHSGVIQALLYREGHTAMEILEEARRWERQHAAPLVGLIRPHGNDRSPGRRLKVGYVSRDFYNHPVGRFVLPLLERHDPAAFDVFCYSNGATTDAVMGRIKAAAQWREIFKLSDDEAAEMIRADGIDILVDLSMHTAGGRLLVFARKPAPVQVTWLAYPGTTGLSVMDHRISDPYLDPVGADEGVYSEKTVRLPETFWCYEPLPGTPAVREAARAEGPIVFGCLNNFSKVSAGALAAWAEILRQVVDARVIMLCPVGSARERVAGVFAKAGVARERLEFVDRVGMEAYFATYQRVDVVLDTFPHAGGTTTCDALYMGVPVVTLAGETAIGRGGVSILSNVGLGEMIAGTREEYVRKAVALAGDAARLAELRGTLRGRMEKSALMDATRFAGNMERIYRQMWKAWCKGDPRFQPINSERG